MRAAAAAAAGSDGVVAVSGRLKAARAAVAAFGFAVEEVRGCIVRSCY